MAVAKAAGAPVQIEHFIFEAGAIPGHRHHFFYPGKKHLINFLGSNRVVNGQITLGMMLSISFIIGQLNSPVDQFISFFKLYQNAKFSIERMGEVYRETDEEKM